MNYDNFIEQLKIYYDLYEKGLKKQANAYMKSYMAEFKADTSKEDYNNILYDLCEDVCSRHGRIDRHWMEARGNAELPFQLNNCVRDYLYSECKKNKMPHLRWFYQLYRNDRIGCLDADKFIRDAYNHKECDDKTVELMFDIWLDILGWGAHHFPDVCIISEEAYDGAVKECKKIINEKKVSEKQRKDMEYFIILYKCWKEFIEENRSRDFCDYCEEAGIVWQ